MDFRNQGMAESSDLNFVGNFVENFVESVIPGISKSNNLDKVCDKGVNRRRPRPNTCTYFSPRAFRISSVLKLLNPSSNPTGYK
jgi:hypothetical protein